MSDLGKNVPIGGVILSKEPIEFNMNKPEVKIRVRNTGDRPIQVGSHFHFFEANKALEFDRSVAYGKRLNIAATTAIRFEPGDEIEVSLISYGGKQTVYGFNNLVDGWTGDNGSGKKRPEHDIALDLAIKQGFKHKAP